MRVRRDERWERRLGGLARTTIGLVMVTALAACDGMPRTAGSGTGSGEAPETGSAAARPSAGEAGSASTPGSAGDTQRINVSELGVNTGDPNAPIQVVEFSDFGCPHCRTFHEEVYPTVYREYVETGKVIWKYVPFVLGTFPNSLEATRAGQCAIEQGDFTPIRDRLFQGQRDWMTARDPDEIFLGYALDAGLDVERFRSCLEEGRREERIRQSLDVGRRIGIQGTPTFFIQGRTVEGNRPVEFFRDVFDGMLEDAEAQSGAAGGS